MQYRSEIDGLRAVAVVPVVLFHAGFEWFGGGFVGVDVFFVISGYLITTILLEGLVGNRLSLVDFYERRIRRILPALFFVMLVCWPFAWMWMPAHQMKDFSESLVAVSLFASNFLFWQESGYFDLAAEEKPLLHTWSLAVEEQYYLVFPLFLLVAWRLGKNRVFWMIVGVATMSLLLSEIGGGGGGRMAKFYLAPARVWELLAGSIAAFVVQKHGVRKNEGLSLLGLAAIVFALVAYDETTPFPSVYTLVPVVGVVLLVLFAEKATLVARLLSHKALVGLGLMSYSTYLWHQPLFAFARIRLLEEPSVYVMVALSLLSLVLGFFSWRFIERPFRDRHFLSRSHIFVGASLVAVAFISMGYTGHFKEGFKIHPLSATERLVVEAEEQKIDKKIFVMGDSHADHLLSGLKTWNKGETTPMVGRGCIPFRNVDRYDSRFEPGTCLSTMTPFLDTLASIDDPALVILSSMGPVYLEGTAFKGKEMARVTGLGVELVTNPEITDCYAIFEIGMRQTLAELTANKNLRVVFALDIPELGIDAGCQSAIHRKEIEILGWTLKDFIEAIHFSKCAVLKSEYDERAEQYRDLVLNVLKDFPSVYLFDPIPHFCEEEQCHGYLEGVGFLYRDSDHLSVEGSEYYAEKLIDEMTFLQDE